MVNKYALVNGLVATVVALKFSNSYLQYLPIFCGTCFGPTWFLLVVFKSLIRLENDFADAALMGRLIMHGSFML